MSKKNLLEETAQKKQYTKKVLKIVTAAGIGCISLGFGFSVFAAQSSQCVQPNEGAISGSNIINQWIANDPQGIQIKEGDTSYTLKWGDTLWSVAIRINVNVETLAAINNINLSLGQQYCLAVGTVIHFDGAKLTALTPNGTAINSGVKITDANKIIPGLPVCTDVSEYVTGGKVPGKAIQGDPKVTIPESSSSDSSTSSSTSSSSDSSTSSSTSSSSDSSTSSTSSSTSSSDSESSSSSTDGGGGNNGGGNNGGGNGGDGSGGNS